MVSQDLLDNRTALSQLLEARRSCRAFLPDVVPQETLRELFALAQRTASWCNTQPWQVTVTSGEATRRFADSLGAHVMAHPQNPDLPMPAAYLGVYDERRRESGFGLYESLGIAREDRAARQQQLLLNYSFFGAPHVAVISSDQALGVYGAVDSGGYVSMLLLAAEALGLAAIAQASVAMYSDFVRDHLGLAADRSVVCAVSFGWADASHPANSFRTTRADVEEAVRFLHA